MESKNPLTQEDINILAAEFNLSQEGNEYECFAKALTLCQRFKTERDTLTAENERLAWNLAGCLTYAEGYGISEGHNKEWETPALKAVYELAKENKRLRAAGDKLAEALDHAHKCTAPEEFRYCDECNAGYRSLSAWTSARGERGQPNY